MKAFFALIGALVLVSCSKEVEPLQTIEPESVTVQVLPEVCFEDALQPMQRSARRITMDSLRLIVLDGPIVNWNKVILLDFDGFKGVNEFWNGRNELNCRAPALTDIEIAEIVAGVKIAFASYNLTITVRETIYKRANLNSSSRIIITDDHEWYGRAGGVAWTGSFHWNDDVPAFVFPKLIGYNVHKITRAIVHEIGHVLGLRHQRKFDAFGKLIGEYNYGCCGESPYMGNPYNQPVARWWVGRDQNDTTQLNYAVGKRVVYPKWNGQPLLHPRK